MVLHRLYLSSDHSDKFLISPDRTDSVVFNLDPALSLSANENMFVRLESASIPIVRFNCNPLNNTFVLLLAGDELSVVTIPVTNYTSGETFFDAINSTPQMISAGLSSSFDALANKLSFFHSQAGNISVATFETTTAHKLLGMNDTFNITIPPNTITYAPRMVDLGGARIILVASETFELDVMDS
ncbi:hypothetical protein T492DRAFT_849169 [Pavlovales sp. CCMP2436]|nr:hypothetical protein T492DRAFT_850006 [Pavlovales sp. CCMP2436]KAJ1618659.1 hypothetical protein T492DRAFT_849169 [Pavlovales sp. CCMP2436]